MPPYLELAPEALLDLQIRKLSLGIRELSRQSLISGPVGASRVERHPICSDGQPETRIKLWSIGCLARRKVSGKLIHVISIYPILATANLIAHFECIPGVNSKNEIKMKDRHYPCSLKTEERS